MGGSRPIGALRIARGSALDARSRVANQLHGVTTPDELREEPRGLSLARLSLRASRFRVPTVVDTPLAATRLALRSLAHGFIQLSAEIARFDVQLARLVAAAAPQLVARPGIGNQIAGQLLVTAGANATRLRSEGAFAMLVGTAPTPASSGKTERQRLNRAGDRQGQLGALHACVEPHVPRPGHPGLCLATHRRVQVEAGDHPLHEALPGVPEERFAGQATGSIQRTPPRWTRVRSRITTATIVTLPQVGQRTTSPALR